MKLLFCLFAMSFLLVGNLYAEEAGRFRIVESTVDSLMVEGDSSTHDMKKTFLLDTQTGDSFIFHGGAWKKISQADA